MKKLYLMLSNTKNGIINIYILIIIILLIIIIIMGVNLIKKYIYNKNNNKFNTKEKIINLFNKIKNDSDYYAAYISLDYDFIVRAFSNETLKKIRLFTESYLTNNCNTNYIYNTGSYSYIYLFNSKDYDEKIMSLLNGLNEFVMSIDKKCNNLYKAGIFEISKSKDLDFKIIIDYARQGFFEALKKNKLYQKADKRLLNENTMLNELKNVTKENIDNGEFIPYYQFIYDTKKDRFSAIEYLSRWNHPKYGIINPSIYIDILKNNNIIMDHDCFMLESACKDLIEWNKKGYYDLNVAINFTRESLLSNEFVDRIEEIIEKYNVDYKRIIIEITEDSILYDKKTAIKTIEKLSNKGYNISIDDFASGYTSLQDLINYRCNRIKIDRSLVIQCKENQRALFLLKSLVNFAHSLNLLVVCEGIEDEEIRDIVIDASTDFIQGFLFCNCLDKKEADKFIKNINKI